MKNILVSLDFDNTEQVLLDKAFELAQAFQSKIWLLHIADPEPDFVGYGVGPQYIRDDVAAELRKEHRLLQSYAVQLNEKGIVTEALLIQGATYEMIVAEAKKLQVDLIITGHKEHHFLYKVLIGSVSEQVVNKSKIPVLVVPL